MMPGAKLSSRQQEVLDYMRTFFAENDQLPPMHSIADAFGFKSANSAHEHVVSLITKGYLERNSLGKLRFVRPERTSQILAAVQFPRPSLWGASAT